MGQECFPRCHGGDKSFMDPETEEAIVATPKYINSCPAPGCNGILHHTSITVQGAFVAAPSLTLLRLV
jgi:hypothetical protein